MKYIKIFEQWSKINEGHSGTTDEAPSQNIEEAKGIIQKWINNARDEEDGDLRKFLGVSYVGTVTEDELDKLAADNEDDYVVLGKVDGVLLYAYSIRC